MKLVNRNKKKNFIIKSLILLCLIYFLSIFVNQNLKIRFYLKKFDSLTKNLNSIQKIK
jgi:hypothetical protein